MPKMNALWRSDEVAILREMLAAGCSPEDVSEKINRSVEAINRKISRDGLTRCMPAFASSKEIALPPSDQCAWLDGDVKPFVRCTEKVEKPGSSWCAEHRRRAFSGRATF